SVVKELVENALDAGARRIAVEVRMAGSALIRVADDGSGMTPEDAEMALRRHATSKIARFEDLEAIGTLGFRGEALPSIASVAEVEILTRPPDRLGGTSVRARGGKPASVMEAGAPAGTTVTVKNLFYNVPARRKFLKTHATETGHILDVVARLALAHPDVAFSLDRDGERVLTVPGGVAPLERIACILGPTEAGALFPFRATRGASSVEGHLSRPEATRPTAAGLYLYVNGRPVRERGMLMAVTRGYEGLLEKGRYPFGAVFLTVPPGRVDVNVHPAKVEVRFDQPREVEALIRDAVREALIAQPWLRKEGAADVPPDPSEAYKDRIRAALADYQGRGAAPAPVREQRAFPLPEVSEFVPREVAPVPRSEAPRIADAPPEAPGEALHPSGRSAFFSGLRYVGQARASYLVLEGREGLFLLDQHAAHERVTFEKLRAAHGERGVQTQRLLIPVTVDLERRAADRLLEGAEALAALGV
ncbi:MAG: DNA mismatch repair endonuclease MutL, partial [Candidatus Methylomirabilis sp.]|nr:DNA mismatch repair endonuclease MutL [Deltaproteobacteria bacterium]